MSSRLPRFVALLGQTAMDAAAELVAGELDAQHGPKLRALRALATLRKIDASTLRVLAARIDATGAEPGAEARARSSASELIEALADWADDVPGG